MNFKRKMPHKHGSKRHTRHWTGYTVEGRIRWRKMIREQARCELADASYSNVPRR